MILRHPLNNAGHAKATRRRKPGYHNNSHDTYLLPTKLRSRGVIYGTSTIAITKIARHITGLYLTTDCGTWSCANRPPK